MVSPGPLAPIHLADLQLAAARQLRWFPDAIRMVFDEIVLTGWALPVWDDADELRFLVNGQAFGDLQWPLPSPDIEALFPALPQAGFARFSAHHPAAGGIWPLQDGCTRFNVTSPAGEHAQSYRTAWYLPDPADEPALPDAVEIAAEAGRGGPEMYRAGGATLARRLDAYLQQRFGRGIGGFEAPLEWGCGSGRMTRYLAALHRRLTAIDADAGRLARCAQRLPAVNCIAVDPRQPLPFEAAAFDLVIAPFVAHRLNGPAQQAWLSELRRLCRPGGIVLTTIWGQALAQLNQDWGPRHLAAHRLGLYAEGADAGLDAALPTAGHYDGVRQSHDHVFTAWSRHFEVIEIVPGMVHVHDLVVLRAGNPADD